MKNRFTTFLATVALLSAATGALAQSNPPYIVPIGADHKPYAEGQTQMTATDDYYEIKAVKIENGGFLFAGIGDVASSYYSLNSWAVNPPVYGLPNPISISMGEDSYIQVEPGTYDITFYTRDAAQSGHHQFIIVPSDNPAGPYYPASLFLLSSSGVLNTLTGTDGVYTLEGTMPSAPFRISYEPRPSVNTFIFGPVSAVATELTPESGVPVEFGKGTDAYFTVKLPENAEADRYRLKIDLTQGKVYIEDKLQTSVSLTEEAQGPCSYYTIGGMRLDTRPDHGIYITRQGGVSTKTAR